VALAAFAVLAVVGWTGRRSPPTARMSRNLDRSLRQAAAVAEEQHHDRATPEHLLLALTDDPDVAPVIQACNVDVERVRRAITSSPPVQHTLAEGASTTSRAGIEAIVQRAVARAMASGNREVNGAGVLVELLGEPVGELLRQGGMTRFDAVRYISHGIIDRRVAEDETTPPAGGEHAVAKAPAMLEVRLLNDDFTPMEFVVETLQRVFDLDRKSAIRVMLQIHRNGVCAVGTYPIDIARSKAVQLLTFARAHEHPLHCVLAPA
jgi:ATP-dependent Clp protease adapter protein ClpS